jgi:hypothetical protein
LENQDFNATTGWKDSIEGIKSQDIDGKWKVQKFKFVAIHTCRFSFPLTVDWDERSTETF